MARWKTHFDIGTRVSGQSRNRSRSRPQRDHPTTLHALNSLPPGGAPANFLEVDLAAGHAPILLTAFVDEHRPCWVFDIVGDFAAMSGGRADPGQPYLAATIEPTFDTGIIVSAVSNPK